jgi:hypothetical protein
MPPPGDRPLALIPMLRGKRMRVVLSCERELVGELTYFGPKWVMLQERNGGPVFTLPRESIDYMEAL